MFTNGVKVRLGMSKDSPIVQTIDSSGDLHQLSWSGSVISYDIMRNGQSNWEHKWTK